MERIIHRKTIPDSRHNNGPLANPPDAPHVEKRVLEELSMFAVGPKPELPGSTLYDVKQAIISTEVRPEGKQKAVLLKPTIATPLTEIFHSNRGGGRVGGGGTSQEALRRAKRKFRFQG